MVITVVDINKTKIYKKSLYLQAQYITVYKIELYHEEVCLFLSGIVYLQKCGNLQIRIGSTGIAPPMSFIGVKYILVGNAGCIQSVAQCS